MIASKINIVIVFPTGFCETVVGIRNVGNTFNEAHIYNTLFTFYIYILVIQVLSRLVNEDAAYILS